MLLCSVTCPCFGEDCKCTFDGKIIIWPFVETEKAKRNSKSLPKGADLTMLMVVTKHIYTKYILDKVLLALNKKFYAIDERNKNIGLQHDNAKAHFNDKDWKLLPIG